jgi:hypothetical protein
MVITKEDVVVSLRINAHLGVGDRENKRASSPLVRAAPTTPAHRTLTTLATRPRDTTTTPPWTLQRPLVHLHLRCIFPSEGLAVRVAVWLVCLLCRCTQNLHSHPSSPPPLTSSSLSQPLPSLHLTVFLSFSLFLPELSSPPI